MTNYVANVIGEGLIDRVLPVEAVKAGEDLPVAVGDDGGVVVLYGDLDGITVLVAADDDDDLLRRIAATFGEAAYVDDMGESTDQSAYTIAACGCIAFGDDTGAPCAEHRP